MYMYMYVHRPHKKERPTKAPCSPSLTRLLCLLARSLCAAPIYNRCRDGSRILSPSLYHCLAHTCILPSSTTADARASRLHAPPMSRAHACDELSPCVCMRMSAGCVQESREKVSDPLGLMKSRPPQVLRQPQWAALFSRSLLPADWLFTGNTPLRTCFAAVVVCIRSHRTAVTPCALKLPLGGANFVTHTHKCELLLHMYQGEDRMGQSAQSRWPRHELRAPSEWP